MRKIIQLGLLYIVVAIIVVVCGFILATMTMVMIGTLLGNLAIWPIIGATLTGYPISFPMALSIAAVMAVILYLFAGAVSDKFSDQLGAVMSLGCFGSIILVLLGFPGWMLLVYLNGGRLTGWAIVPCGIVTALLIWMWMNRKKEKVSENGAKQANHPIEPFKSADLRDCVHDEHNSRVRLTHARGPFPVPKPTPKPSQETLTSTTAGATAAKVPTSGATASGARLLVIRASDFRSLTNIEMNFDELTVLVGANNAGKTSLLDAVQFAIGANRRILGKEDIRLAKDEADVPKDRRAIVDVLLRPVDEKGKVADTFPQGSFWTGLWGDGIAQDDDQNDMVGMRTVLEWSDIHGDYRTTRKFLREWKSFDVWQEAEVGDFVNAAHIEPIALHYIDAKRDLEDDLRTRGSFWRRLTDDLGLSESDVEKLESALSDINKTLVDKSEVLKHLRDNLLELKNVIAFEKAGIDIAPVPRHLRDLSRGIDVSLNSGGTSAFPLTRHGMGTRSLASLLVFRAFALWRRARAEEGGDKVHTLLALEEPEAHLHPHAQRALFAQIRDIPGQRIVSTHSPYFVAQSRLEDLRLLSKIKSDTNITQLDMSKISTDERRKVEREVLASRGDLLFSRALILFEGETEEQALVIFAESFWGATAHEKGLSFVGCGGSNYQPFIWLAKSFGIRWYILCDSEDKTIKSVNAQLKKLGIDQVAKLDNCSVISGKTDYEGHLLAEGYLSEIEKGLDAVLGAGSLDKYIDDLHGTLGKKVDGKQSPRDYKSRGGRERAAKDLMQDRKTRFSGPVATAIVEHTDKSKRVPPAIRKLFERISKDLEDD